MKKSFPVIALLAACTVMLPSRASAVTPYIRGAAGIGLMHDTSYYWVGEHTTEKDFLDSGLAIEGAAGVKSGAFRAELAAGYQSNEVNRYIYKGVSYDPADEHKRFTYSVQSYMINLYADIYEQARVHPFIMAGLGIADVDFEAFSLADSRKSGFSDTVFAWQAGAGVGYTVSGHVTIEACYRYFAAPDIKGWNREDVFDVSSGKILLGVRYEL